MGQVVSDSTADAVGVIAGDRILSVGGQRIDSFNSFGTVVRQNPGKLLEIEFEREGKEFSRFANIGERVTPEGALLLEGIEAGDQIISVDGTPYSDWEDFSSTMLDRFAEISFASVEGLADFFSPEGLTGFVKGTFSSESQPSTELVGAQTESEDDRLLSIYGAARLGSAMLDEGTHNYLWFLVLINVFVGIFNLVPLLPLDGGHAAIATYERLRSRKGKRYVADINKLIPVTWLVITVLVGIALIALYRDIVDLPNFG